MARRFNPATGDVIGEPARLADNVVGGPTFSVSTNGVLTFRRLSQPKRQLVWFTRDGKQQDALGEDGTGVGRPRISPDGKSVAVQRDYRWQRRHLAGIIGRRIRDATHVRAWWRHQSRLVA